MADLTKEDVKDACREAMAEKFEMTLGIDCRAPDERVETRKDMEWLRLARTDAELVEDRRFLRSLRKGASKGGEKILFWLVGLFGSAAVAYFWPDIARHFK
jgi:hypothetical protein